MSRAEAQALPHGHVFSGVRALKDKKGVAVYVVVSADDRVGPQLARFVLADGVLTWHEAKGQIEAGSMLPAGQKQKRASIDALLAKLQPTPGSQKQETSLQRLLRFEREDTLLTRLQDSETGLFDGPYATLKLDEEWKRAHRFQQPLSLVLLDLGVRVAELVDAERRLVLAEAAGVFLNECRDIDVLARFQPTVFLFLLPGTGPDGAGVLANRILASLRARFSARSDVTPVAGLCSVPGADVPDRKAFLAIAEACLARAASTGPGTVSATWQ
ncbi:MAG: GGDEF domain-containing protein [Planctomycetes bacterium]|nr:GGDEF domain-containing protein [Planctomycetota bacterium]